MATITTDQFLDTAPGTRTAGETWTVNGATLTIRTDTRVYAGAPAGMTGSLGSMTLATAIGGHFIIDATKVRWMQFTNGAGVVPAIGSVITQGGVSGYLLGVWATVDAAPSAIGSSMPVTGFLKFREVSGGTFTPGALSGIDASAVSPDVPGWIEVVWDVNSGVNGTQLNSFKTYGDWFYLGVTDGTRGQIVPSPTNGGGANTQLAGFQVETAPGSNVFEWWGVTNASTGGWSTTYLAADSRAKAVEHIGNGAVRIGTNGTNAIGYLPPAGCRIRMPNIIFQAVLSTARTANLASTAAQLVGISTIAKFSSLLLQYIHGPITAYSVADIAKVEVNNCALLNKLAIANANQPVIVNNCFVGPGVNATDVNPFNLTNCNNAVVTNLKVASNAGTITGGLVRVEASENVVLNNISTILFRTRATSVQSVAFNNSANGGRATNISVIGSGPVAVTNTNDVIIKNVDWIDNAAGPTTTAQSTNVFLAGAGSSNVVFDGLTFGNNGELPNTHPYGYIFQSQTSSGKIKVRNVGTRRNPLSGGTANIMAGIWVPTAESNIALQRIYVTDYRDTKMFSSTLVSVRSMKNILVEDVYGKFTAAILPEFTNSSWKKIGGTQATATQASTSGSHWMDFFTSDTAGHISWVGNPPSPESSGMNYITSSVVAQGTGYVSNGVSLDSQGDEFFSEMPYFAKGHTGFQNAAPVRTETSNSTMVLYYQINNGAGWSAWKALTAANLVSEYVNPAGMKLRLRGVQGANPNSANLLNYVKILTTSTLDAQADNLYPLDVVTLTLEGLKPGSEVRAYVGTDPATAVEIGGTESSADTFSFTHTASGQQGYIHIFAMGYQPVIIPRTYAFSDSSLLIQQVIDRNYINP